jgi:DNA-binding MarR family transcriptional regulator
MLQLPAPIRACELQQTTRLGRIFSGNFLMSRTATVSNVISVDSNVQLLIQLLKLASLISRPMEDGVASPNDIGLNELKIVMCLGGEGAMAGHDITELVAMPPMNVSRALAALMARGWIEPVIDPANRRRKPVCLNTQGWSAYRAMTPDVGTVADYLLGELTAAERKGLARTAQKVIARMESWAGDHPVA